MKILHATDGSSYSEFAARILVALRPPSDAHFVALHVKEPPHYIQTPAVPPSYVHEWHRVQHELQAEIEKQAEEAIAQAQRILGHYKRPLETMVVEGQPADQIVKVAREIGADLTVVGSRGHTDRGLFALGDVAQKVKRYASSSVLLGTPPPHLNKPEIARVILATDGSENAMEAARFLSRFGVPRDAEVVILHVLQQPKYPRLFRGGPAVVEQVRQLQLETARIALEETQRHLQVASSTRTAVREGYPADEIIKAGSELEADLVVVGSKGLGGVSLFLLGSVSQNVCRYADRPVLLVRPRTSFGHPSEDRPE